MIRYYKAIYHNGSSPLSTHNFTSADVDMVCNSVYGFLGNLSPKYEKYCDLWETDAAGNLVLLLIRAELQFSGKGDPLRYLPLYF